MTEELIHLSGGHATQPATKSAAELLHAPRKGDYRGALRPYAPWSSQERGQAAQAKVSYEAEVLDFMAGADRYQREKLPNLTATQQHNQRLTNIIEFRGNTQHHLISENWKSKEGLHLAIQLSGIYIYIPPDHSHFVLLTRKFQPARRGDIFNICLILFLCLLEN
ncbi:hypothetical protein [Oryzibacter oryziterrae]|uniref:hypothetical protein n=1 Tax=Oryzibacter oryziterrae TaxID=2766474 RepID=UPI001F477BFA|nr:hypothetical protein [Oryzibacter oryziterrae]